MSHLEQESVGRQRESQPEPTRKGPHLDREMAASADADVSPPRETLIAAETMPAGPGSGRLDGPTA